MKRRDFLIGSAAFISLPIGHARANEPVVTSGNSFRIGLEQFQLADIIAPSEYVFENRPVAYFDEAKTRLSSILRSQNFQFDDVLQPSRWGVKIVRSRRDQVVSKLEAQLIASGVGRVAPQTDNVNFIDRLLAIESVARQNKTGIWSLEDYQVFDSDNALGAVGAYHLIEGAVRKMRQAGNRFYFNFGDNYRTDFTASAALHLQKSWLANGLDFSSLEGAQLRIRGFVNTINGPSIDLTHSRQIEILNPR